MDEVQQVCSTASSVRKANQLRVRLPLSRLTVASPTAERLQPFTALIADEMNVKEVSLSTDTAAYGRYELVVNARAAGPRLGKDVQRVIKAVKAGNWSVRAGDDGSDAVSADGIDLAEGEYTRKLVAVEPDSTAELPGGRGLVVLDTTVTEELQAEGWAKDRIRELQDARRNAGLDVSDRIEVRLYVPDTRLDWATRHAGLIAGEVLAVRFEVLADATGAIELGDGVSADLTKVS